MAREEADLVIQGEAQPIWVGGSWYGLRLGQNTKDFLRNPVVSRLDAGKPEVRLPT